MIGFGDGMVDGHRVRQRSGDVPRAAVFDVVREQIVVTTAEQRRSQRARERERVGRVVDRAQEREQVAHLATAVHERARLGAVRNAGFVERVLEVSERGARREQDADVAEPGRSPHCSVAPTGVVAVLDLPLLGERDAHRRDDIVGFAGSHRRGVGLIGVGDDAEHRHGRPRRCGGSGRLQGVVLGLRTGERLDQLARRRG